MSVAAQLSRTSKGRRFYNPYQSETVRDNNEVLRDIRLHLMELSANDTAIRIEATILDIRLFKPVTVIDERLDALIEKHDNVWRAIRR